MKKRTVTMDVVEETTADRRAFLSKAAMAAAVTAVAGIAVSDDARASNGDTLYVGGTHTGTATTSLSGGSTFKVSNGTTANNAAIVGSQSVDGYIGVYGESTGTSGGSGVYGKSTSTQGRGVYGLSTNSDGIGVYGEHAAGGTSAGTGVLGVSSAGAGVVGRGTTVDLHADGTGRVLLDSAGAASPPTTGTVGTIARDAGGSMWVCVATNTWRRIAGPTVAGALVPITPTRVYDSRQALPTPGKLAAGSSRTVSVKDGRDPVGGAVTTPNLVPVGARAVTANVTVVGTVGTGYLTVNPGGTLAVTASTINWFASNQILANGVLLPLNDNRQVTVICGGVAGVETNFIIDVTGYYL